MQFRDNKAIYLQIAEYIGENILLEKWKPEDKISSVRELAVELEVNPNTVMRTYEFLQNKGVIYNKRGIGFFVANDAVHQIKQMKKDSFLEDELPVLFRSMYLLQIDFKELEEKYNYFIQKNFNNENK